MFRIKGGTAFCKDGTASASHRFCALNRLPFLHIRQDIGRFRESLCRSVTGIVDIPLESIPITKLPVPARTQENTQEISASQYTPPPLDQWHLDPVLMSGCENGRGTLDVAVLLSGGVDSSLALKLLTAAEHRCKAFYLQIWFQEDFRNFWDSCPWEEDLEFAKKVCDLLGVELEVVPMTNAYWDKVVSSSVEEIRAGRTPNPDMLCNSRVKFGAFLEYLEDLEVKGGPRFDRVASGHYARVTRHMTPTAAAAGGEEEALLVLTPDAIKDQTYFLAHLSPKQLSKVMFPLGGLTKPQVRALAAAAGLATQSRKDSQGICFLGKVKFPEFVKEHLGEWQGLIVEEDQEEHTASGAQHTQHEARISVHSSSNDTSSAPVQLESTATSSSTTSTTSAGSEEDSTHSTKRRRRKDSAPNKGGAAPVLANYNGQKVVGIHQGYWFYTVGQRGGIKLPGGPWYVVRKDCDMNIVYVSRKYYESGKQRNAFLTAPFSWLSSRRPDVSPGAPPLMCKVRHGPHAYQCQIRAASSIAHDQHIVSGSAQHFQGGSKGVAHMSDGMNSSSSSWDDMLDKGAVVVLDGSDQGLAAGQYAVLYQDGVCLGTAKIDGCVDVQHGFDGQPAYSNHVILSAQGIIPATD